MDEKARATHVRRIAIVGAGPAGTTLARLLQTANNPTAGVTLEVTIFEGENGISSRVQGGTLDLHEGKGLAALKAAGLDKEFRQMARYDGDAFTVADKNMTRYLSLRSSVDGGFFGYSLGKPEIDRHDLRMLLLDSLRVGTVRWGCRVAHIDFDRRAVVLTDGTSEGPWDLIIGADGAHSVVRKVLTSQNPFYSGVGGWTMVVPNAETSRPLLSKLVARGSIFFVGDGNMVLGQQLGDKSIHVTVWGVRPEDWMAQSSFDVHNGGAVKEFLLQRFHDWAPEVRELISAFDESTVWPRSLVMLPVGMTWEARPDITILGDAAHVMTPFIGEGVNAAMTDALELYQVLVGLTGQEWKDGVLFERLRNYEKGMFKRVAGVQKMTEDMMKLMLFTPGAPRTTMARWIARSMSDDMDRVRLNALWVVLSVFYFIYSLVYGPRNSHRATTKSTTTYRSAVKVKV